ncbi:DUF6191 domain-containing protein [Herbihabitans rhizosphaerae]|uniref:DUF6191 domain-containing protein n=1 Tax=Herbihabitans rhizosphaerae TaxID=1872711 RepID=UPI001A90CE5F|nr:DUF6191 domain-containing protein [Herbihabitans rhizosphaerae]
MAERWRVVKMWAAIIATGIVGSLLMFVGVGSVELLRKRRAKQRGTPLSATYVNEVTAMFNGSKRIELDYRDSMEIIKEEDSSGAPPAMGVDLDRKVVRMRRDQPGDGDAAEPITKRGSPDPSAGEV